MGIAPPHASDLAGRRLRLCPLLCELASSKRIREVAQAFGSGGTARSEASVGTSLCTPAWARLTFVIFDGDPHMTASGTACLMDTIGNDHYGALLHDPIGVAA